MRVLVDTNVLLRGIEPKHPSFLQSKQAVPRYLGKITPYSIALRR